MWRSPNSLSRHTHLESHFVLCVACSLAVIASAAACAMSAGAARTRRARQFFLSWGTQQLVFVALLFVVANLSIISAITPRFTPFHRPNASRKLSHPRVWRVRQHREVLGSAHRPKSSAAPICRFCGELLTLDQGWELHRSWWKLICADFRFHFRQRHTCHRF